MHASIPLQFPPDWLDPELALVEPDIPGAVVVRRGKVRTVYEAGPGHLLIVASDRLSAYDCILPTPIPGKGAILSTLSAFWMKTLRSAQPNHLVTDEVEQFPEPFRRHPQQLGGRAQLVRRAERVDIECVVRGHLTGSAWREYRAHGTVCGTALPAGLHDGARLDPALFTPATKNDHGHDENIAYAQMAERVGEATASALRERSLALYEEARRWAWDRGLVLADTKFEFGRIGDEWVLIDEALTPDSSRYWDREAYAAGELHAFDKQFVRDWLDASSWNHEPPAPALPPEVVQRTQQRYLEAATRLSGGPR
jgi:phosphoribosylaminoimidazole-succinocarboxamide synthase